jgi:hypothetical protein
MGMPTTQLEIDAAELSSAVHALSTATSSLALVSSVIALTALVYLLATSGGRRPLRSRLVAAEARSVALRKVLAHNAQCVVGDRPAVESMQRAVDDKLAGRPGDVCAAYPEDATRQLLDRAASRLVELVRAGPGSGGLRRQISASRNFERSSAVTGPGPPSSAAASVHIHMSSSWGAQPAPCAGRGRAFVSPAALLCKGAPGPFSAPRSAPSVRLARQELYLCRPSWP